MFGRFFKTIFRRKSLPKTEATEATEVTLRFSRNIDNLQLENSVYSHNDYGFKTRYVSEYYRDAGYPRIIYCWQIDDETPQPENLFVLVYGGTWVRALGEKDKGKTRNEVICDWTLAIVNIDTCANNEY